jgi:sulfur-oxidizing protein SoxY
LLKGTATAGLIGVSLATGVLTPRQSLAAWPKAAFDADNLADTMNAIGGSSEASDSDAITIKAPDIAENGAVVPISVDVAMENVQKISVIAEKNPAPLAASFDLGPGAMGYVSTRIKMGTTSTVIALVQADGKLYKASKEVKVTIGGCGG